MRRKEKAILAIGCIMFTMTAYGQIRIDTVFVEYHNSIIKQNQVLKEYNIVNESKEDYLTWISSSPINGKTEQALMHEYFLSRKGDFSFLDLMTGNTVFKSKHNIGISFIKRICPGESFSYIISKSKQESSIYDNRIVIIKSSSLNYFLRGFIIDDNYFYPESFVILSEEVVVRATNNN